MKKQGRHPERALSAALIRTVKKPRPYLDGLRCAAIDGGDDGVKGEAILRPLVCRCDGKGTEGHGAVVFVHRHLRLLPAEGHRHVVVVGYGDPRPGVPALEVRESRIRIGQGRREGSSSVSSTMGIAKSLTA